VAETVRSPLKGKRIVITRASLQSEVLSSELSKRGAFPTVLPLVSFAEPEEFAPLDAAIAEMPRFDWMILTSAQTVRAIVLRSKNTGRPLVQAGSKLHVAAVGPVTAEAAKQAGLTVQYVANTHNGVALADELGERLRGRQVLLPRSDHANPDLPVALRRHGAEVTEVIAYRTLRPAAIDQEKLSRVLAGEADALLFFSPSAVQHFSELLGKERWHALEDKVAITAVGRVTASALRETGAERLVVAPDTTAAAVVQALVEYFAGTMKPSAAGVKRG
jgi:uroporphyrinogen-III synthase